MSSKNALTVITQSLPAELTAQYKPMLENIAANSEAVSKNSSNFYKSHSQFMNVTLDITAITPVRSIKHTLAEIDQTKEAVQSAYYKLKRHQIKAEKTRQKLLETEDPLDKELISIKLEEQEFGVSRSMNYVQAAIRKLNFLTNQHNNLMKHAGLEELTEEDYEREEVKYHIMTAMKQALTAARSRGGVIDEGNHIYLFDLGIPGAEAQAEIFAYLKWEASKIEAGEPIDHLETLRWLEKCADKWVHCPSRFANSRGFDVLDMNSLHSVKALENKNDE